MSFSVALIKYHWLKATYRKLEFSLSYGFRIIDALWDGWHGIVAEEGKLAPYILFAFRKQEREQEVGWG